MTYGTLFGMIRTTSYRLPVMIALGLHIVLFIALMIELPNSESFRMNSTTHAVTMMHAVAVNQTQVDLQIAKMKQQEQQKNAMEETRVRHLQEAALAAQQKRLQEQQRIATLRAEKQRLEQERIAAAKQFARKQEQERLTRQKQWQEQRARALAAQQQQLQKKLLEQQLASEQRDFAKEQSLQRQGILDKYKAQILQAIQQQWIVPSDANKQRQCVLLIDLAPGGVVLAVKTLRSSGDTVLDRSARVAVFKASPLPVPNDPALFDQFREIRLTVRPDTALQ